MAFDFNVIAQQEIFSIPSVLEELLKLQEVTPYLPLKEKLEPEFEAIASGHPKTELWSYYLYRKLPYDIEHEHMVKYREQLRQAPIGIQWSAEELKELDRLSDIKSKRYKILEKSGLLSSVYIPHIKYQKEMINYPDMPIDIGLKSDFEKGIKLFNAGDYTSSLKYLQGPSSKGNYLATQLICDIYLHDLTDIKFHSFYNKIYSDKSGNPSLKYLLQLESSDAVVKEFQYKMGKVLEYGKELERRGLPLGAYIQALGYEHMLNVGRNQFDRRFRPDYVKHLMRAANNGSYQAYSHLATNFTDMEWALCGMISSLDYKCFDEYVGNFDTQDMEMASPRNLAIVRLAAMWGSATALHLLTFGPTGNFVAGLPHMILQGYPKGGIYMPDDEQSYRGNIYKRFYGETGKLREDGLIPDLDMIYPPKPVIHCPYGMTTYIDLMFKHNKDLKHPLDKTATEADILRFREELHRKVFKGNGYYIGGGWAQYVVPKHMEEMKKQLIDKYDSFCDSYKYFPEGTDLLFGYLNVLKLRELRSNPLYYPSGRPYIYPASVYKKHPTWY